MFNHNKDFYPTPAPVIDRMIAGLNLKGATVWEPEAGKCDIVNRLINEGAEVIACEKDPDLVKLVRNRCPVIAEDMLTVTSDMISHVKYVIMNPPFSEDEKHINHVWDIAPPGCKIVALCNQATIDNGYSAGRKKLLASIEIHGMSESLGDCFGEAERKTGVQVAMVTLVKPGANTYDTEFEGFFIDEEEEQQENGIMSYNVIRDLVNRYVGAIKIYDEQLETAVRLNQLTRGYFGGNGALTVCITREQAPVTRSSFKKDMQKAGWNFIFDKMNLKKYATRGLKDDINKFVEEQTHIPFTMKNIYHMLDLVVQTAGQRMDKALLEVFDKVTSHSEENKYNLPGWKTNSHYLLTKKFIVPNMCWQDKFNAEYYPKKIKLGGGYCDTMEDLIKALCYITGDNYDNLLTLSQVCEYPYKLKYVDTDEWVRDYNYKSVIATYSKHEDAERKQASILKGEGRETKLIYDVAEYGKLFEWNYFNVRAYKKGTMHFEFKDEELWGKFNQRIAKLKGYPLFEGKTQTAYQARQNGRPTQKKAQPVKPVTPGKQATILFTAKIA